MSRTNIDSDLIIRCQNGELAAFDQIYYEYKDYMYRLAMTILFNEKDAEDVVQDACLRIFTRITDYRGESTLKTWITTIVVNLSRDKIRRRKVRQMWSLDWIRNKASQHNVAADFAQLSERKQLWQAVQQLDEAHRLPVILRYYEHLSCDEIAEILGLRVSTVYSRLNTARTRLRKSVAEMGGVPNIEFPYA